MIDQRRCCVMGDVVEEGVASADCYDTIGLAGAESRERIRTREIGRREAVDV